MPVYKNEKTNKWYYRTYVNDPITGERIQKSKSGFALKRDALEAEAELKSQYLNNEVIYDSLDFNDLLAEYIQYLSKKVKESTLAGYKYQIDRHIEPHFKGLKMNRINRRQLEVWYKEIDETSYSYKYKNKLLTRLKGIFEYAEDQYNYKVRYIRTFPLFKKQVNEVKNEVVIYDEKMFEKFISFADNDLTKTIFYTFFYTGMRVGELRAITWNDINFGSKYININKQINSKIPFQGPVITTPKSESSIRVIQVPNILINVLKDWRKDRIINPRFKMEWRVFGDDSYISENRIRRKVIKIIKNSGLPYIKLHEFRHSYTTMLYRKGIDPKVIQSQTGHSSVKITLDTYTHMDISEAKKSIINLFDE